MADKKVVIVLPVSGVDQETYRTVRSVLRARRHPVTTASVFPGAVEASDGTSLPVDMRLRDIKTYEYDGYIFLGGEGARAFFTDDDALKLAKDISYKTIGAMGEAVAFLAKAGAVKNKKVTAPLEWADMVRRNGGKYTGKPLETDEKLITAQGKDDAQRFANAIAEALAK